jgi:L,D-transpeptidase ErfK/SrfK
MSTLRHIKPLAAAAMALAIGLPVAASARSFSWTREQTAVGGIEHYTTRYQDTLLDVARHNDIGYTQLMIANPGIDPWLPGKGRGIVIPQFYLLPDSGRRGIVINLAEQRLFYFPPGGGTVETVPIGVGVQGRNTPHGTTRIASKEPHPVWYPPPSIRAEKPELPAMVPAGPNNPLGDFALHLGWNGYLIHGTNIPDGVGRNSSHGCIRLYPEDIAHLFGEVGVGTPVQVVDQQVEAAWVDDRLYVAVFPDKEQAEAIGIVQPMKPRQPPELMARVTTIAGTDADRVDWDLVKRIGLERTGIPTPVTPPVVTAAQAEPTDDQSVIDRVLRTFRAP